MSRANPDIARLKLDEIPEVYTDAPSPITSSDEHGEQSPPSSAVHTASPHGRLRNSTLATKHADLRAGRREDSPASNATSPAASQPSTPTARPALLQAPSSSSVTSQSNHNGSSSRNTPVNSVLELKRFFGKGRKKHEHGVKVQPQQPSSSSPSSSSPAAGDSSTEKKRGKPIFNIFGRSKKKNHSDSSPSSSIFHLHHHSGDSSSSSHHHHHHYFSGKTSPPSSSSSLHPAGAAAAGGAGAGAGAVNGESFSVKHKPPRDLDPNFVVHGPDYEADWDPFHTFGLMSSSEHMPFLESGITKYGNVGRDMGSGAGGSVKMMERPSDNKLFAVKEFRARRPNETPQKYAKHMTAEYALGAALHHKNIIETIDLIKEGDRYFEVMEYGPHDFFEIVMSGSMTTPQINSSFHQIMSGVAYLHSMGVAHRDLKLDNCVVTNEGVVKIIDFGSAVVFKYPMSTQIHLARGVLGSDPYLAPEVFLRHPYQPQCADVWSCGIIYCCTYLRRFPWKIPQREDSSYRKFMENPQNIDGLHPPQDKANKITGPWRLLRLLPRDSRPVIASILKIDVNERATIEDIQKDIWFSAIREISVLPAPLPESHA